MKAKQRQQAKAPNLAASATNARRAKVLVSNIRMTFRSRKFTAPTESKEAIVFDRQIRPGIFIPSKRVSDSLAEEYREVVGTLGVWVYGSLKREMTLAEINGLEPDDPSTVDEEMLQITRRNPGRVFFDVWRIGPNSTEPHRLTSKARAELKRAIGKSPSDVFISEVERSLGSLLWDREQVRNATPRKVRARIAEVLEKIDALWTAIDSLHSTDWNMINEAEKRERWKGRRTITGNELLGHLTLYRRHVAEAEGRLARSRETDGGKGRMPEYADEVFAYAIAKLVENETGKRSTSTRARTKDGQSGRGSTFTEVLKILLSHVSKKPRRDVEALASRALKASSSSHG